MRLLKENRLSESSACLEEVLSEDAMSAVTLCNYAVFCLKHLKNPEMVNNLFRRFIMSLKMTSTLSRRTKSMGLLNYARFLQAQSRFEKAEVSFRESFDLDPNNVVVLRSYAKFLFKRKEYKSAESMLKTAFELDPTQKSILLVHGNCYGNKNDLTTLKKH